MKNMKIVITIGKPAKKAHIGPRSQFAATIKVGGRSVGDEYVGETEAEAVRSLCSELQRESTIADIVALAKKPPREPKPKPATAQPKGDKPGDKKPK